MEKTDGERRTKEIRKGNRKEREVLLSVIIVFVIIIRGVQRREWKGESFSLLKGFSLLKVTCTNVCFAYTGSMF